jgi:transposase
VSRTPAEIVLDAVQRQELEALTRASGSSQAEVLRARIVLLAALSWPNEEIAAELKTSQQTVCKWRRRYARHGLAGLQDDARSGRPAQVSETALNTVLTKVTQPPKGRGRWSCRSMAKQAGLSKSWVQQLWSRNDLKPHQTRTFKLSNDKQFEQKFWDIVGLYLSPPQQAVVLCRDEKSQCQALERSQPGLPLGQGHVATRTHDYYRHGTLTLFAALDYLEGKVLAHSTQRHRHQEWIQFLRTIDREVPAELEIHLILDNYATHKTPQVKRWLKRLHGFIFISPRRAVHGSIWWSVSFEISARMSSCRVVSAAYRNSKKPSSATWKIATSHLSGTFGKPKARKSWRRSKKHGSA